MKTTLSYNRELSEDSSSPNRVRMIKALRAAFNIGLKDGMHIADWFIKLNAGDITQDLPRATPEGVILMKAQGMTLKQPPRTIPIKVRLRQLIHAAIDADEGQVAGDLLEVYVDHYEGYKAREVVS